MKNFKKVIAFACAAVLTLSLAACGSSSSDTPADTTAAPTTQAEGGESDTYKIGICQIVQHVALDAATKGFEDALTEKLGDKVTFDEQNASGDTANCATIINGFVSENVDLILANATPPLQSAASATSTIPILGTSITDYASALGLEGWDGTVGGNVSGTSDLAPLDQQAAMIKELFPDAVNIGLIYCSAEANSEYQVTEMEKYLADLGFTTERFSFTDTNDVASVTQQACDASDVIYIPTDNTAASNTEAIANVIINAKVPVICGEEGICKGCGVATLSIDYYDLGYATGLMAYEILVNGADISTMPVQYAPEVTYKYNAELCEALGITPPENYEAISMD